ncbi:MAG: immune inhibitor A [Chloroflexi bacterium]|nr:immune inhibitor A [Chloroflexota bacterium]
MFQPRVRQSLRWVGAIGLIAVLLPTMMMAKADSGGNHSLTWADAPAPPPVRHEGDAETRWGWEMYADVFGPFFTDPYQVGDRTTFALGESPSDVYDMELYYRSQYAYFWFEPGTDVDMENLQATGDYFDKRIWWLDREIFGPNASPGIDGDTRIHLVHVNEFYPGLLGFFSPKDQCAQHICPSSNQRDAVYLMLNENPLGSEQYYATLAHEFQHLIQFNRDGNEYRWMDEGLSQLAEHLIGVVDNEVNHFNVEQFMADTNRPLNSWSLDYYEQSAYYGAGYLFSVYLYERFGSDFIKALTLNPHDGLAAVYDTLQQTGQNTTLNELMIDWYIASLIDNPYVGDGRYYYQTYDLTTTPPLVDLGSVKREFVYNSSANQYGADYLSVEFPGTYQLDFNGSTATPLVDVAPASGEWMWWSYNAVGAASSLTRTVDLTRVTGATLRYNLWWETGELPDYLHVLVSTNNGQRWDPLSGHHMQYPDGYSTAPGLHYSGYSDGWVADEIDLSRYAGQDIQIRFEYITNNAMTGPGFLLDDVEIPEIGLKDDVETSDSGWIVDGFLRTQQTVGQDWSVAVVKMSDPVEVEYVPVEAGQSNMSIDVPEGGAVVIVSAQAPFTLEPAKYRLTLTPTD